MSLHVGSKGADVQWVQRVLGLAADGVYGPVTMAAVRTFQVGHGLHVDGVVGPQTIQAMGRVSPQAAVDPVALARAEIGHKTPYLLGHTDCAWFAAQCLGVPRRPTATWPWWFETTNVYTDAMDKQLAFERILEPVPGCAVVYPDTGVDKDHKEGHIGIVTQVDPLRGVDCSASQYRKTGDAIHERDFGFFARKVAQDIAIFVRPRTV